MPPTRPTSADDPWERALRLFREGSFEFVDAIRAISEAKALAVFADKWYTDTRIEARRLLNAYLDRPFNALRHEPLVKRLFKFADNAGDDAIVARFLVGFDRSIRRRSRIISHWDYQTQQVTEQQVITTPSNTELPRDDRVINSAWFQNNREVRMEGKFLFSVRTRQYLRRRAWRYFRKLGRRHPERYIPAVSVALKLYTDADVADGVALLDNWGLVHILFHHSPTLVAKRRGWVVAENGSLSRLQPDPMYRKLWLKSPEPILDLVNEAQSRTVRQWGIQMLRRHFPERLTKLTLEELLRWLESPHAELNDLAAELIEKVAGLERIPVERWLRLVETARVDLLDRIIELVMRLVKPEQVSFADAVKLAMARPVPLARLGRSLLLPKRPASEEEVRAVFGLRDAECEPLRPVLVKWACTVLREQPNYRPEWVLEFLDSRHEDVREAGWEWLQTDERSRESTLVWSRLLESPYDNIRLRLVAMLEDRMREGGREGLSPGLVKFLWASVLLNIHRGGRAKPFVVRQIIDRLSAKPDEADELLPMVAVALRSVRGPEFRAGLAGIASFAAKYPQHRGLIEARFPELSLA